MVVVNRSERFSVPMESFLQRGRLGWSWAGSETSNISAVDRKNRQEVGCLRMCLPKILGTVLDESGNYENLEVRNEDNT